jgi:hypothetical protein
MSDLNVARHAIEAELARAEQGLQFYTNHVESLKSALAELRKVEQGLTQALTSQPSGKQPSARRPAASRKNARTRPQKKAGAAKPQAARPARELPSTGSDYWLQFIVEEPRTAVEITRAAIDALGFIPTPDQVKVLKQRISPSLETMVKSKKIKDSGTGRERRFCLMTAKSPMTASMTTETPAPAQLH